MLSTLVPVLVTVAGLLLLGWHLRCTAAELAVARSKAATEGASRAEAEAKGKLARRQLQLVADNAPFLIAFLDPEFIFRFVNQAHVLWFQRPHDQVVGKPIHSLVDDPVAADYLAAMSAALATHSPQSVVHQRSWFGNCKYVELTFVAQLDEGGQLEGYWLTARDATEVALRERTLLLAARRDPSTGLFNQPAFTEALEQALVAARRGSHLLTVAYLDVNRLQPVNAGFSHDVDERFLKELGRRIQAVLRPADVVARLDGDHIAVIMPIKAADDVRVVGSRLLETTREPFVVDEHRIVVTTSIGFAIAVPGDTVTTLVARAEEACAEVKQSGRDGMVQAPMPTPAVSTIDDLTCH